MTEADRLTVLDALWSTWAEHGRALTDEQWALPTRLDGWDVRSLYAHAATWPLAFAAVLEQVRDAEPTHATAAALLRDFNRPGGVAETGRAQVASAARQHAAAASTEQLVEQFARAGPAAITRARALGPVVVDYLGVAVLALDETVSIGIVEATVHLLDLRRALGAPADAPAGGLAHTASVLLELAPAVDFVEVATGRSDATLFPVMR